MTWKLEDEWRQSKLQHFWERSEYWEESWRLEETCCNSNFSERPSAIADVKNYQRKLIINNLDIARGLKKSSDHESDGYTNCYWCSWHSHQRISNGTRGFENKRMSGNHPNYSIVEIGQNTEKSPRDKKRLARTQTPVRNYRLMLI